MSEVLVSVIMGSKSDAPVMEGATEMLKRLGIPFEKKVISAHRSPNRLRDYLGELERKGVKVVIAGAGKAAHLPGVIASLMNLPVIGVPMPTSDLGGLDSLLSIVQMPAGVPVACVAIKGAENAAILAAQILALSKPDLRTRLQAYRDELAEKSADD
jgi:5-(carboxyamino)imidazole ribonucleotide mutase